MTYPAGESPKVFQEDWFFGARCTYIDENGKEVDISDQVSWCGDENTSFSPDRSSRSFPTFKTEGVHPIELSVNINGEVYLKEFYVTTIISWKYHKNDTEKFI